MKICELTIQTRSNVITFFLILATTYKITLIINNVIKLTSVYQTKKILPLFQNTCYITVLIKLTSVYQTMKVLPLFRSTCYITVLNTFHCSSLFYTLWLMFKKKFNQVGSYLNCIIV